MDGKSMQARIARRFQEDLRASQNSKARARSPSTNFGRIYEVQQKNAVRKSAPCEKVAMG
jgi:hypothetical protein